MSRVASPGNGHLPFARLGLGWSAPIATPVIIFSDSFSLQSKSPLQLAMTIQYGKHMGRYSNTGNRDDATCPICSVRPR